MSFIIKHWDNTITQFTLNFLNEHTFIRTRSFRKIYLENYNDKSPGHVSLFLGRIIKELITLDIIKAWSPSKNNKTYKKIIKKDIFKELEKRKKRLDKWLE